MERPPKYVKLNYNTFSGQLIRQGGTFLGTTNKGNPFKYPMGNGTFKDRTVEIIGGYHELGLDGLIVIGGDGSMKILKEIADKGKLNIVAIPKTIDNDVGATENSIGFHTAVSVATNALDNLQFTAASHNRTMILEVMGRDAGHIALNAGIAGGADIILIPEIKYSIEGIIKKLNKLNSFGIKHSLMVVAEAVKKENGDHSLINFADGEQRLGGIGNYISEQIMQKTNIECRVTTLGHVQRGAAPSTSDRILASAFGIYAVDLIANQKFDRMVAWKDRKVVDYPIKMGIETYKKIEPEDSLLKTAKALGIYIGDIK